MASSRGAWELLSRIDEDSFFAKDSISLEDFKARGENCSQDLRVFRWWIRWRRLVVYVFMLLSDLVEGHGQRDAYLGIKPWGRTGSFFLLLWLLFLSWYIFVQEWRRRNSNMFVEAPKGCGEHFVIHPSAFLFYTVQKHWFSRRWVGRGMLPQNSLRIGQKRAVTSDSSRRANSVTGAAESLAASIRPKRKTVAFTWTIFSLRKARSKYLRTYEFLDTNNVKSG